MLLNFCFPHVNFSFYYKKVLDKNLETQRENYFSSLTKAKFLVYKHLCDLTPLLLKNLISYYFCIPSLSFSHTSLLAVLEVC